MVSLPTTSSVVHTLNKPQSKSPFLFMITASCALLCFLLVFLASTASKQEAGRLSQELAVLQDTNRQISKKNEDLRREIAALHSSTEIAKAARNQLGMIRPGETVFFVSH
jgi:cell division protein DivIC